MFETKQKIKLKVERGAPVPLGATVKKDGVNFAVFSKNATEVTLVLYTSDSGESAAEIKLDIK